MSLRVWVTMGSRERGADFDRFVAESGGRLLRTAYLLTGDRGAAEDLLQDDLERMFVAWPRVQDPLPYARRALVHGATNRWRSRSRRPEAPLADGHDAVIVDAGDACAERDRLMRALAQLPARQRAVVVLRWFEDLSEARTAEVLRCSTGTVKSQNSRAMHRLRHLLHDPAHPRGTR